jgi:hypothetical protein
MVSHSHERGKGHAEGHTRHDWAVIFLAGWVLWIETIAPLDLAIPHADPWTISRHYDRREDCLEGLRIQQQRITQEAAEVTPRDSGFVARPDTARSRSLSVLASSSPSARNESPTRTIS